MTTTTSGTTAKSASTTIRCSGEFFNHDHCDRHVSLSTRLCAYCDRFQVDRARIVLCRSSETPFAARKRLIRIDSASITLDLRFFALHDDNSVYDGLLVFKDRDQAAAAIAAWPDHLVLLPSLIGGDRVDFVKCHWCRRKVHPIMLPSCTKPSCVKKANSKKRPPSKPITTQADPNDADKRRRRWRICPDQMRIDIGDGRRSILLPRAVIQSPEPLSAESITVRFGEDPLRRDVDYICGLQEVVILAVPWPQTLIDDDAGPEQRLVTEVVVADEAGVCGTLQFTYVIVTSPPPPPPPPSSSRPAASGLDLDEQIERLHLFEDDDTACQLLSPLFIGDDHRPGPALVDTRFVLDLPGPVVGGADPASPSPTALTDTSSVYR